MLSGLYSAGSAVVAAEQQQEAIAQNLAHVNVPGYRRVATTFATTGAADGDGGGGEATVGARPQLSIDFSPGNYVQTGRPLDLSLEGDGFFVVETPDGPLYTRDGVMRIVDGELVNNAGHAFRGAGRLPPEVPPGELTVDRQGRLSHQGQQLGRLEVVRFADNQQLLPAGPTAFAAPEGLAAESPGDVQVLQGSRELANVSATQQLVQMLIGMRYHEASQRALKSLSDALRENITGDQ